MIAQTLHRLVVQKTRNPHIQFLRYLFVGGSSAVVDLGTYSILTTMFEMNIYLAALIGYTLGFAFNHFLSVIWIFESKHSRRKEVTIAYTIALGGLLWTELLLYVFVDMFGIGRIIGKVMTQVIVLAWNFGMRKKFVFH